MSSAPAPAVTAPRRPTVIRYIAIGWVLIVGFSAARVISNHAVAASVHVAFGGLGLAGLWIAARRLDAFWQARLAAEEARRVAEHRWQVALDSTGDGLWEWNATTDEAYYSPRWKAMLGYADHEFPNSSAARLALVHPDDRAALDARMGAHFKGTTPHYESEHRLRCKDGTYRWVLARGRVTDRAPDGSALRAVGTHTDITERKQASTQLERLGRLYAALCQVNERIVRAASRDKMFSDVCEVLVKVGGFKLAWIGWHDPATRAVSPVAFFGDDTGYLTGLEISSDERRREGRGPTGTVIREGRTYVCNDFASDPHTNWWNDRAMRAGINASTALPIRLGGQVAGALMVYADEKGAFGAQEISLMERVAADVSYALDNFQQEALRRQAERALVESEARYREFFEGNPNPTCVVDRVSMRFLAVNEAALRFYGYTREEFMELSAPDFRLPEERAQVAALLGDATAGYVFAGAVRHRKKNGEVVTVEAASHGIRWDGHDARSVQVVDITERARALAAVQRSEAALKMAQRVAGVGSWVWHIPTNHLEWSDEMYRIFGISRDGFAGDLAEVIARAIHPDDREIVERSNRAVVEQGSPTPVEYRVIWPDGTIRTVWAEAGELVRDAEGEPLELRGIVQDITARKQVETTLRESHEMLAKLAAQVPGVIYQYRLWTDGRSAFPFASPGMNDIYEVTPEEVREDATPVFGRLHPEDLERVTNDILASAQNLTAFHCEFRVVLPRQGLRWRLSDAMPERTPDGGTLWHGIISDITERKHAEEALRRNERQLALAMDLARAGSWELNADATVFTFTDSLFALLGTTAEREGGYEVTIEKCAREFVVAEESALIAVQAAEIRATTDPKAKWKLEYRVRRRDGAVRNVTVDIMMVTDEAGRIIGSRGVNQDITDRKEAEAALKARERELDLFFSQSLDGFFFMMLDEPIGWRDAADREAVLDYVFKHQRVTRANDALLGQYGATREQFIGRTPAELTAHDLEAGREGWRQLFDAGRVHVETAERKLDGTPIWIEGDYICLYDAAGRITGHFGVQRDITQRKHAEAELLRSQTRLARAMELGRMGAWDFDLATTCFTFSDQLFALYGTTAAREGGYAMSGEKYAREFFPAEDIGMIAAQAEKMRLANSAGAEWQLEHRIRRRDGAIRHVHVRITVITDAAGRVVGARGVNTDITERIQSEAERRKLSRAVEQSPVTVVITDTTGAIEYANPQFTKVTGYALNEVLGKTPRVLKSGLQPAAVYRDLWTTITGGREWRGELCNRRKDETLYWEDASISPVFDEQGRITHYLAVKEDITERRESLARMREQAALLDVARDAIMVVDLAGIVRFWNRGAELIYGWSAAEAVGRNLFTLVYDGAHPVPLAAREAVLRTGEWTDELKQCSKSGATIIARCRSVLMRNPAGDARSILLTASDITEAKRLEAIFLRAQRLESVGSLASGVAHDLNNVLAPIMLSIELLRPLAVTPEDREALQLMGDATRRGADVVRQLLLFGRGSDAPSETMEVGKVLNEMLRMMRETFPRNLTIDGGAPRDLWPICGHATQIYQVVLNLCVNARDAMPSGGRLTLAARNLQADEAFVRKNPGLQAGRYIEIVVRDTGTGIPAAIVDRIFDPFFTTKELGKGTGLGLSTVVGIAKSHGGLVTVNSHEGAGSEFSVYLPAIEATPGHRVPLANVALPKGHGELVLLVDDESSIRQIVSRALEEHGYRTLVASNGGEGLTLARQHLGELRIVVLDMMMPGIDGVQVVQQLRGFAPALPIIACSGLDRYRGELNTLGLARLHFLHKPFAVDQLCSAVRAGLDGSAEPASGSRQ